MKKLLEDRTEIAGRWDEFTRDKLVERIDKALDQLSNEQRLTATFGVDIECYPYDDGEYPKLFVKFKRLETDAEETYREAEDKKWEEKHAENERLQYEYLAKKFAK